MSPVLVGSYSARTTCPKCRDRIRLEDIRVVVPKDSPHPKCPNCGTLLRVSKLYAWLVILFAFAVSWLVPYLFGFRAHLILAWIPSCVLTFMLVPNFAKTLIPPRLYTDLVPQKRGVLERNATVFFTIWFSCALLMLAYVYGALRWAMLLLGGSQEDLRAVSDMVSIPLGWINSNFIVRQSTNLSTIIGVIVANTFFYTVFLFPIAKIFRAIFRRGRVTQLGISKKKDEIESQDEEDEP